MHYFVGVILPEDRCNENGVEDALARHEGNRWDWWVIGGRYDGLIKGVKSHSEGYPHRTYNRSFENNYIKISDYLAMRNPDKLTKAINKMLDRELFFFPMLLFFLVEYGRKIITLMV
jgi:hypothetical protein